MTTCVLVVEDDADIRETMAEILRDSGYEVHTAAHGKEALTDMRACPPCIVVLDLMMPVMDGWEVVDEMKADPVLSSVPVCVVSAFAEHAPGSSACVISEPIKLNRLLEAVEAHCGRAG